MKLMIDDDLVYRKTPNGFYRVTTVPQALDYLDSLEHPVELSEVLLDNDLGEDTLEGYKFLEALIEGDKDVHIGWLNIHSRNTVAVAKMVAYIESARRHGITIVDKVTTLTLEDYGHLTNDSY